MSTETSIGTDSDALESVCDSLAFPPELAELLPVVFSRCVGLGGLVAPVLQLLTVARVNRHSRVIDLACGKGHITCAIAKRLGARVRGIDACGALLREARASARRREIEHLVTFRRADVLALRPSRHDVAVMIGWLGAEHAPWVLRTQVNTGKYYIFDDATRGRSKAKSTDIATRHVDACGDELVATRVISRDTLGAAISRDLRSLELGVQSACVSIPSRAPAVRRWFARFRRHAESIVLRHVVAYHLCRKTS